VNIFFSQNVGGTGFYVCWQDGHLKGCVNNSVFAYLWAPPASEWHHYVFNYDATGVWSVFLDGTNVEEGPSYTGPVSLQSSGVIGSNEEPNYFFKGSMDDVRMYVGMCLSTNQILTLAAGTEAELPDITNSIVVTTNWYGGNMTLVGTNTPASHVPFDLTAGRFSVVVGEVDSPLIAGQDYKGYIATDDTATNWLEMPFGQTNQIASTISPPRYLVAGVETNLPGGSNLVWKFQTCNTNKSGLFFMAAPQGR
jgi:hypothetical protein